MQSAEISFTVGEETKTGVVEYPDQWCFVFNPNYLSIKMEDKTLNRELTVRLTSGSRSYDFLVNLYNGDSRMFISKIMQVFFDDAERIRTVEVSISLLDGNTEIVAGLAITAIWGGLQIGEKFGRYGLYKNGENKEHIRNVVWFRKFPFNVTMYRQDNESPIQASADGVKYFTIDTVEGGNLPEMGETDEYIANPVIVLNITHKVVYAMKRYRHGAGWRTFYYSRWKSFGIKGSYDDYMLDGKVRKSIYEYWGGLVQWNGLRLVEYKEKQRMRVFRCRIDGIASGALPEFSEDDDFISDDLIDVVFDSDHKRCYAIRYTDTEHTEVDAYFDVWYSSGLHGNSTDYNMADKIREDTEFDFNGIAVRYDSVSNMLREYPFGNSKSDGLFDLNPALTFPEDFTNAQYAVLLDEGNEYVKEVVNISTSDLQDGYYLRWIDRNGFLQYYLFRKGTSTTKSKASSDALQIERVYSGVNIGNLSRPLEISNTETMKCCAVNLTEDVLRYVKTITNAAIIDMYAGIDSNGIEVWLPVQIGDGNYTTDPNTRLSDYEITLNLPDGISQSL